MSEVIIIAPELVERIKKLVSNAEYEIAFDQLILFLKQNKQYKRLEYIAIQAYSILQKTKKDEAKGIISFENAKLNYNQATDTILNILIALEEGKYSLISEEKKPKHFKVLNFIGIGIFAILTIILILFVTKNLYSARAIKDNYLLISILKGIIGITTILFICFLLSDNRKEIDWQLVRTGLLIQIILALLMLKTSFFSTIIEAVAFFFIKIIEFSDEGSKFLFGDLVTNENIGYIFAFRVLPAIIFFSALSAIFYYLGILQKIIHGVAWLTNKIMRLSGPESLAVLSSFFIGQLETPSIIKPYLSNMTRSEIFCLMTSGMASVSGAVLAAYVGFLGGGNLDQQLYFAKNLIAACIMVMPASIIISKIILPEVYKEVFNLKTESNDSYKSGENILDAITLGTLSGLKQAVNIGATIIVFTALIYMLNYILENSIGTWSGLNESVKIATNSRFSGFNFNYLLGLIFAPIAWIIGVPAPDVLIVGQLLGQKTMLNEFVAYLDMGNLITSKSLTDKKSILIATYGLCGFANFTSIGIQIATISSVAPNQRINLTELGFKALIASTLATLMTASLAGVLA